MKFLKIFLYLIIASNLLSQIKKEPVPRPAPFQLTHQLNIDRVIQPLAKSATVGDTTFYLREDLHASPVELVSVEFYKLYEDSMIVVYAETDEYDNGNITDQSVTSIVRSMLHETPSGSKDPNKGIYNNLTTIFGAIPDVDNNGKLFVLLVDARDGYEQGSSDTYVAGYFDPLDQSKSKGNYSDIIYIDTNPAKTDDPYTLGIVAHELQHLIHYNYDPNESTWLNEGFSELAPKLLGYDAHSYSRYLVDTNRKLAEFDGSLRDYSKVGLWTFYIYQRFGEEAIQHVLRNQSNSTLSYEQSIQALGYDLSFKDVLKEWFIANLVNDETIDDGRYSYYGADIPNVQSDYFHSNFTDGQIIQSIVKPQATQYLQFNGGKNINFEINIEQHSLSKLIMIKDKDITEIEEIDISSGNFMLEDLEFGKTYDKLSFVVAWTATLDNSNQLDFSYSAIGVGGTQEIELSHDDDQLDYYISLDKSNVAAEKFHLDEKSDLKAVKFNTGTSTPVNVKIYERLTAAPLKTYHEVTPNYQEWTLFNLPEPLEIDNDSFYVSIGSATDENYSIGYSDTDNGFGLSYLSSGNAFYNLNSFQLSESDGKLEGNWLIRAVITQEVFAPPALVVMPDSLFFFQSDSIRNIVVKNIGTEALKWKVSNIPDYLNLSPTEGVLSAGKMEIEVRPDTGALLPGLYKDNIHFTSNANEDSIFTALIKRNPDRPQTAFVLSSDNFENNYITARVFNIGNGNGNFEFKDQPSFLGITPASGRVHQNDTIKIDLMIDSTMVNTNRFTATFDNGNYEEILDFKYPGELTFSADEDLKIYSAAPNPFLLKSGNYTKLMVRLKNDQRASLKIINLRGQVVRKFRFDNYTKGLHIFHWDGLTDRGEFASSGIYFIHLQQSDKYKVQKMLLIK